MIQLFHDGMVGHAFFAGDIPASFDISNKVKQGCVLAPVLFNILFTNMLSHGMQDLEEGVHIKYRFDGA